jgi:THAP domain
MTSKGQRVRFPKDKERLKQWLQKISQDLKADQITEYMGVCKRHFDPIFVNREYSATGSDGTIRTWPRESPVLAHDAVPTTFPHTPFYLSSFIPLIACELKAPSPDELMLQHGMMLVASGLMRIIHHHLMF